MVKVHVPVEKLGWNFYGYGLLDNNGPAGDDGSPRRGAARRAALLGPAEIGLGGVWGSYRRPRYAVDLSSAGGPFDVYGEAAFRSAHGITLVNLPNGVNADEPLKSDREIVYPEGLWTQAVGGASWTFNYTEKNTGVLSLEYYFNQYGYRSPAEDTLRFFTPRFIGRSTYDPAQANFLYRAQHSVGLSAAFPGLPNLTWVTATASGMLFISDLSGLARLDVIFRVLTYLNIQLYGQAFYGNRFSLLGLGRHDSARTLPGNGARRRLDVIPRFMFGAIVRLAI